LLIKGKYKKIKKYSDTLITSTNTEEDDDEINDEDKISKKIRERLNQLKI
jgi:hypothetical protein